MLGRQRPCGTNGWLGGRTCFPKSSTFDDGLEDDNAPDRLSVAVGGLLRGGSPRSVRRVRRRAGGRPPLARPAAGRCGRCRRAARLLSSYSSSHVCVDGGGDVMDEPRVPSLVRLQVCGQCMTVWALLRGGGHVLGLLHISPPRTNGSASPPWHEPDAPSTIRRPIQSAIPGSSPSHELPQSQRGAGGSSPSEDTSTAPLPAAHRTIAGSDPRTEVRRVHPPVRARSRSPRAPDRRRALSVATPR